MPTDASRPTIKTDGVAERIAKKLRGRFFNSDRGERETADLIRTELSSHEQKVRELVEAAKKIRLAFEGSDQLPYIHGLDRLRAALKALEEQP